MQMITATPAKAVVSLGFAGSWCAPLGERPESLLPLTVSHHGEVRGLPSC